MTSWYTRKNEQLDAMLSTTCCNVVLHTVEQCCTAPCQQLLLTTIVHSCSRSTTIVQSLLTTINKLVSSTIANSCSNNIVTTIVLCQHRTTTLIKQYSSTLSIQQVLLNLDNNIVQALFDEQRSTTQLYSVHQKRYVTCEIHKLALY